MRNTKLTIAIFGIFIVFSTSTMSAGFVNIPITGFSGSAYMRCMAQPTTISGTVTTFGNFGSGHVGNGNATPSPSTTAYNTCALVPSPANDLASPDTNYSFVTSATRNIVVNNIYTTPGGVSVGSVLEVVWRKPPASAPVTVAPMCIIGTRVALLSTAYSNMSSLSNSRFSVNDIARGGWNGLNVDAAYSMTNSAASRVYRIGRTYTSVQHRTTTSYGGGAFPAANYLDLPGAGSVSASINGVNLYPPSSSALPSPTTAQQDASIDDGWIDFTTDTSAVDDDGTSNPLSAMTYIKFSCNSDNAATINSTAAGGWTRPDVIRLRQTGQESSPFISVSTSGFVLPGQPAVLPASTSPF